MWLAGGGGGHSHRREGELDGIDQDFDETQVEIQFAGKLAEPADTGSSILRSEAPCSLYIVPP